MNSEYHLKFPKPLLKRVEVTDKVSTICRYPVPFAQKSWLYEFDGASLINQKVQFETFHIDMFHLLSDDSFEITYSLDEPRIFFNFLLNGQINFTTGDDQPITRPEACSFYLSAEQAGNYKAKCPSGATDVVIISVVPRWVSSIVENYPTLGKTIQLLFTSKNAFDVLPHWKLDHKMKELLLDVLDSKNRNKAMQQAFLSYYIGLALQHYEDLLQNTTKGKIFSIKQYIDLHYLEPELTLKDYSEMVGLSEQTVSRRFQEQYNKKLHAYYRFVRLMHVHRLIEQEGISYDKANQILRYSDNSTFRKLYKKFLKEIEP